MIDAAHSLATVLLPTVAFGTTLIIPASPKFDLGYYLRLVTRYRATFSHIAPAVAVALRSCPHLDPTSPQSKGIDLSSIAAFLTGGAPVPVEVVRKGVRGERASTSTWASAPPRPAPPPRQPAWGSMQMHVARAMSWAVWACLFPTPRSRFDLCQAPVRSRCMSWPRACTPGLETRRLITSGPAPTSLRLGPEEPTGKLLRKDIAATKGHKVDIARQSRKAASPNLQAKL
ncbi:hypothetical protein L1887_56012 [Cichorium endivia]|nr:hypothetical protein L1887_56012 [Cichorium endivia]